MKLSEFDKRLKVMAKVQNFIKSFKDHKKDFIQIGTDLINEDYGISLGLLETECIDIEVESNLYKKYFIGKNVNIYLDDLDDDIIILFNKKYQINKNLCIVLKSSITLFKNVERSHFSNNDIYIRTEKDFDCSFLDVKTKEEIVNILFINHYELSKLPSQLQEVALFMNKI